MKPYIPYSILAAALACGMAQAVTSYTTPVGYVSLGDTTVGQPAIKANTDVLVSLPLDRAPVFQGVSSSISGSTINFTGTSFGDLTTTPHVAKIEGGTKSGLTGLITVNTGTSITVQLPTGESLTGVTASNGISIRPAWTLATAFGTTLPAGTQLLAFSGTSSGINLSADLLYEFDGTDWLDGFTFDPANNVVVYPGESIFVRNNSASAITSLVVTGEVSTSNSRVLISNLAPGTGQDNYISFISPVDEAIGLSALGSIATPGDQVFEFDNNAAGINKSASYIVEWDGTNWLDGFTFDIVDTTFNFQGGKGYIVRRSAGAPGGDTVWSNLATYNTL